MRRAQATLLAIVARLSDNNCANHNNMFKSNFARICTLIGSVAILGGCTTAMPSGTGPDGNSTLTILGPTPMGVMQKAGESCPNGYEIASKMIQAGLDYSMTIECKARTSAVVVGGSSTAEDAACPPGYTCTPAAKPKCPAGYTCVPN